MSNEPVALLPHLTDEELEQLQLAVGTRYYSMVTLSEQASAMEIKRDTKRAANILQSLMTAIAETREQIQVLRRGNG